MGSTLKRTSSFSRFCFLLSLNFAVGACAGAEGAKKPATDDNKTAMVWVNFPGFIKSESSSVRPEKRRTIKFDRQTGNALEVRSRKIARDRRGSTSYSTNFPGLRMSEGSSICFKIGRA